MKFTGERYMPEFEMPDVSYEHWHRYLFAAQFSHGKSVLDIASGEGYGSALLAESAQRVVGVDYDAAAIAHSKGKYTKPNLEFMQGLAQDIPMEGENHFDLVISFETIEHLDQAEQVSLLNEIKLVIKPDGLCMISTPNKLVYSDLPQYQNEFHKSEFYLDEFQDFLEKYFEHVRLLSQKIYPISYMWDENATDQKFDEYRLSFTDHGFGPTRDSKETRYAIGVCSMRELNTINNSLLIDVSERLLKQTQSSKEHWENQLIQQLQAQVADLSEKNIQLSTKASQLETEKQSLEAELKSAKDLTRELSEELNGARDQIGSLRNERMLLKEQMKEITQSFAWAFVNRLRNIRLWFAPPNSKREALLMSLLWAYRNQKRKQTRSMTQEIKGLTQYIHGPSDTISAISKKISVVIPTKNAGPDFKRMLSKLTSQRGIHEPDLIIVDSGSTDCTIEIAQSAGARVIEINPDEFSHSSARNKGAQAASGDYILLTVQDAMPISDYWLWALAKVLQDSKQLALVSCAEYPRSDSDLFYRIIASNHYKTLNLDHDRILCLDKSRQDHFGLRSSAQINNVAALYRRETLESHAFNEDITYAEDLELGVRLIKEGKKLGFLYSTRVIHSHKRPPVYFFKRAYVDTKFLNEIFEDYPHPELSDSVKLAQDIVSAYRRLIAIERELRETPLPVQLNLLIEKTRQLLETDQLSHEVLRPLHAKHSGWIDFAMDVLSDRYKVNEGGCIIDSLIWPHFVHYFGICETYMREIYEIVDSALLEEFIDCLYKALALQSGAQVGCYYLSCKRSGSSNLGLTELDKQMTRSV